VVLAVALLPAAAMADAARVNDALRLRVLEWQPIEGVVRDWPAVSGEYVVGADGAIMVPFLGRVPVAGVGLDAIGADLSLRFQQRFALSVAPDATVEISASAPVYIMGAVAAAGEYGYRPGLTVAQVLARAGGVQSGARPDQVARDLLLADGAVDLLDDQHLRLTARAARLRAERDGAPGLSDLSEQSPQGDALMAEEMQIMQTRRDRLDRELAAIDDQKALLLAEIASLEAKTQSLQDQIDLASQQSEATQDLAGRGLVVNARMVESARALASLESQLLDVAVARLRAQQGVAEADRSRMALIDGRVAEIGQQLQQVEAELAAVLLRRETQLRLMALAQSGSAVSGAGQVGEPVITVARMTATGLAVIMATPDLVLLPGDVVEVAATVLQQGAVP